MKRWEIKPVTERFLERIFARAKRYINGMPMADGSRPGKATLKWMDELSWNFLQIAGNDVDSRQQRERCRHTRQGRAAMLEDPFIAVFGVDLKQDVFEEDKFSYKSARKIFVNKSAEFYGGENERRSTTHKVFAQTWCRSGRKSGLVQ
jgi:hypothetical protein